MGDTLKRVVWYFEERVVLLKGRCDTLSVMLHFEEDSDTLNKFFKNVLLFVQKVLSRPCSTP